MAEVARAENLEGFLYKLDGKGKKWEKRHFTLSGDKLEYFKKKGAKAQGTIELCLARGVREKVQCKCKWPSGVTEEFAFGLATEERTYYFHSTAEEGDVSEWKSKVQAMVETYGNPDTNWQDDLEGKPESSKSFIARKTASVVAKTAKVATKVPGVDPKAAAIVDGVADVVEGQADMDPNASTSDRAIKGATSGGKGAVKAVGKFI